MTKIYVQGEVGLKATCHAIMLLDPEQEWEIDVNKKKKKRSNSQNSLMWMWLEVEEIGIIKSYKNKYNRYLIMDIPLVIHNMY